MMKGKSLVELAQAVQAMSDRKVDVVADTRNIEFKIENAGGEKREPRLLIQGSGMKGLEHVADLTPHTIGQITEHTGIPAKYAQRMLEEAPRLMEMNVNHWFREKPATRMIRAVSNTIEKRPGDAMTARAFLSNKYHRMENEQLLGAVLPELHGNAAIEIQSTELTDTRMYLKVTFPRLEGEVKKGDLVQYGFTLKNSEIGMGAFAVEPFVYRLVCLNGMTVPKDVDDARMRRAHLGTALAEGADYFSDSTLRLSDQALMAQLRDTLRAMMNPERWAAVLRRMRDAAETSPAADPIVTVERVTELLALPKTESNAVLTNFLRDGDYTKWGLLNAVTAVANDIGDYDRATELEQAGGRLLSLPDTDWKRLAKAA